jgi:hypothetical protein
MCRAGKLQDKAEKAANKSRWPNGPGIAKDVKPGYSAIPGNKKGRRKGAL